MPRDEKAVAKETGRRAPLEQFRTWTVTFGIALFLLATMYTLASTHAGGPQLGAAYRAIAGAIGAHAAWASE